MSATERAPIKPQPWPRFVDGTPYPSFCWLPPFARAVAEQSSETGLVVIAIGEYEEDVAHGTHGEISPEALISSIVSATNGIRRFSPEEHAAFAPAYEEIITAPGRSNVDVLVMKVPNGAPPETSMGHFGERAISELVPHLGSLSTRLGQTDLLIPQATTA